MRRSLRLAQASVLAVVVSLAVAGCGDKDESAATKPESGAAATTEAATPAKALTQEQFTDRAFTAMEKAGSVHATFQSGSGTAKFSGEGDIKYGDPIAIRMKATSPSSESAAQELTIIGDTMYVNVGGTYLSMELDSLAGMGVPDLTNTLDPDAQKDAFAKALVKFEQEGAATTLDGVKATPYEITIDPTKAPDAFGTTVKDTLTFTYFLGPDDLPRRMTYKDANGTFVADYSNWGDPVDIKAPAKSEVMPGVG